VPDRWTQGVEQGPPKKASRTRASVPSAGTDEVTTLSAVNDTTPTLILTNTGTDTDNDAGPNLLLTPSTASGSAVTASATGGALTTTGAGFFMPGFEYANYALGSANKARNARLQRAQQAMRNAKRA
jgi:hypothetical protein